MSTTITLYRYSGDERIVTKSLSTIATLQGTFKAPASIMRPIVEIDVSLLNASIRHEYNYMYIPALKRYYFITDMEITDYDFVVLHGMVDVLKTYDSNIRALTACVTRNENVYKELLDDNKAMVESVKQVDEFTPTRASISGYGVFTTLDWSHTDTGYKTKEDMRYSAYYYSPYGLTGYTTGGSTLQLPRSTLGNVSGQNILAKQDVAITIAMDYKSIEQLALHGLVHSDLVGSFIGSMIAWPFCLIDTFDTEDYPISLDNFTTLEIGYDQASSPTGPFTISVNAWNNPRIKYASNKDYFGYLQPYRLLEVWDTPEQTSYKYFSPHYKVEIYIPFIGYINVDPLHYWNHRIWVYFCPNLRTGEATFYVYSTDKGDTIVPTRYERLLYSGKAQVGIRLPVNTTNMESLEAQRKNAEISLGISMFASMLSIAVGGITKNPFAIASGISGVASGVSAYEQAQNNLIPSGNIQIGSGESATGSIMKVKVRYTYDKYMNDQNLASEFGLPLMENTALSSLTGMTVIENPVLSSMGLATKAEKTELKRLMREGIIL